MTPDQKGSSTSGPNDGVLPLVELKSERDQDRLSRESYWEAVAEALMNAQSLASLLSEGAKIRITPQGLFLDCTEPNTGVKLTFDLDPDDVRTFPFTLLAEGIYESALSKLLFSLIDKSETFVDIGANIGFYTIAALRMKLGIRVVSFEPNPMVFSKLRRNLQLNECFKNVSTRNQALSNEEGNGIGRPPLFGPRYLRVFEL